MWPHKSKIPLSIKHLTKCYDSLCAVNGVSFDVQPGEIFGLLGPNGAGKTSTISVVNTLESPSSGQVEVFGYDITKHTRKVKSLLGCVPQEIVHHGFFSVESILHFQSGYYGIKDNRKQIEILLEKLNLNPHRKKTVKSLSGGMKRRLMIAKALLHAPQLVILDEPTAGVDIELRIKLWDFVKELRDQGVSFLITTHYIEEAEELCDRIAIIDNGTLVSIGKTKEIICKHSERKISIYFQDLPKDYKHPNLDSINHEEKSLTFHLSNEREIGPILKTFPCCLSHIKDIKIHEGSLEHALHHILGTKYAN